MTSAITKNSKIELLNASLPTIRTSNNFSWKTKINVDKGYPALKAAFCSLGWMQRRISLQDLEKLQHTATKCNFGDSKSYKEQLVQLPLSLYTEMHVLMLFFAITSGRSNIKCKHLENTHQIPTRQFGRGELQFKKIKFNPSRRQKFL